MKKFNTNIKIERALLAALLLSASAVQAAPAKPSAKPLNVAFAVYPDMELLDFSGPMDVFTNANGIAPGSYNIYTVAASKAPVATQAGIVLVQPRFTFANSPQADIVIVPGAGMEAIHKQGAQSAMAQWLRRQAPGARQVMSVCTGAFLLGQAGLLNGKQATTHWASLGEFQKQFPRTKVLEGRRFIVDGRLVTAAGVSSGIDGALYVVEKTSSKRVADFVSRSLQYRRDTPAFPFAAPSGKPRLAPARSAQSKPKPRQKSEHLSSTFDPICGMEVKDSAAITYRHDGHLYGFCSEQCRDTFAANPDKYLHAQK